MPEGSAIRILIADASRMTSQLMAAVLRRNRNPHFEVALPSGFSSTETADEIARNRPQVALVSGALEDGPFAGYSVLRKLQPQRLPTRIVLLLEECDRDLVLD